MTDKTIWHPAEERPTKSCPILIHQDDCDEYRVANYCKEHDLVITDEAPDGESWKCGDVFYAVARWCYIEDLEKL
jgi:hypothetical protein